MLWYTHKMWVGIFLSIVHMLHANDILKEIHLAAEEVTTIFSSTTTANATCGASNAGEWFYNPLTDTCFFISINQMYWDDAERDCNSRASQLASVTVDDNAFLLDIIKRQTIRDTLYWIGLRLTNPSLLTHHWIDGNLENVFRNWNRDEPNPKGVQACTLISNIEGFWLDDYCHGVRPYRYICKKSKAPLIPVTTVAPELVETWGCPSTCVNCVRFGDSCYYISPRGVQVTWDEARNACRAINPNPTDRGGHSDLVSIHDQLENDFLFAQMGLHDRQNRWIGLHEDWQKSVFYWSDQTPFNFNFWEQHEPLTTFEPECILIVSGIWLGAGEGRWNDISCQAKQGYICKMKKDRSVTVPVVEVDRRCDPNFEYIDGACFGVFPASSCEFIQPGSRLATVTNIHENVFIRLLLAKLQRTSNILDADVRALLGGVRSDSGRLSWQSGCYPSYNNIRSFYSDPAKRDTCVYMNYTGEWSTKSCADTGPDTRHQYVVCEKRQVECSKLISTNNGTCPDGFDDPCHDYCYKISHSSSGSPGGSPVNLTTARTTCSNLGGSLVAIRNEDDQKCIGKYIESATVNLWLGLYEKTGNVNGNLLWAWPDGTIANYDHWNAGEPSDMHVTGPDREECVEIMSNGFWNNVPCYGDRGYICEKLKIDETTAIPLSCPNGWTTPNENSQNCYKVFYAPGASSGLPSPSIPKLTWQEAENSCSDFKGHLASIASLEEQNHLRSILGWHPQHYSYWIGLYEDGTSWKWSDDTPFLGVQFFDLSSNSSSEHAHDCVGINYNGNWLAQNCLLTWGWICEVPKGVYLDGQDIPTLPTITTTANETCGVSVIGEWFYNPLTDSCFLVSQEAMSWSESEISCLFQDSQLATVFKDDNSFLTNIISRKAMPDTLFWIGLRLTNPSLLTHHWIDGTFDNVFRHWAPGEPNPKGVQACVLLSNLHGFWLDDYCAGPREYRFICKKNKAPVVPATTVAPELVETWGCPSTCLNCVRFRDSCYYISPRGVQVTWDEARNACLAINPNPTDRGGHSDLVSIHDQLENDFLFAQMGLHDRQNRWIGLHEDWQKWVHYWSDQTPFDFDLWEQQEPQITSEEECVMIVAGVWLGVGEGRWNDISCRAKQGYICKMKKDRSVTAPVVEADRRCDPNFEYINGACFGVFPTPSNTDPVFSPCQSIQPGSRLATVTNIHENVFIRLLLARLQHNISTPNIKALLGGTTSENGRLTWSSGCYPSYNNIRGFYSDPEKKDSCLFMQYSGEWSTKPCLDRSHQFVVCEKRQVECSQVVETNNLRCPIGFDDPCNEYCYRISHSSSGSPGGPPVSLEAAKTTCSNLGGSIVAIRNEDDQNCIAKYIESANSNLWLGLYEATGNTNGNLRWQWLDGSIATYYHWNEGEPNDMHIPGPAREECTEIMSNGFWNNVPCTGNRGYICEKLKIPAGNDTCGLSDSGTWVYHNETDSCYFISNNVANWTEADTFCLSMDSHLATIEAQDQEFLTVTLSALTPLDTLSWIGLRLVNPTTLTHSWIDGNLASLHRAWDVNEPNPMGVQACVVMVSGSGKWRDDYCQRAPGYRFICRKAKAPIIPVIIEPPAVVETWGCPVECQNCTRFRDSCYYISPSPKADAMTWDEARNACRAIYQHPTDMSKSSELVSIHDQLEQDFIFSQMGVDTYSRWIGLHEDWDRQTLFWTDQTPVDFLHWAINEPRPTFVKSECVHIFGEKMYGDGRWNDLNCDARAGYVCKMKKDSEYPAPIQHPDTRCHPHFQFLNGACFAVFQMPEQTDPDEACDSMQRGSRLATITSIYENVFIRLLLAKIKDDVPVSQVRALLGGQLSRNGRLSWKSGCYPSFNNIANFFSDQDQTDRCVSMQYDGKWVVHPCWDTSSQYVVCEQRKEECSKLITTNDGTCPSGFEDECHDYCYHITHSSSSGQGKGEEAMFEVAKTKCSEMGGSLVSIRSEEDQKCIAKYVESMEGTLWLGLYETTGNTNGTVNWKWLDDDFVDEGNYRNWGKGEPNQLYFTGPNREACTEMTFDGFWNNVPCSLTKRGYVCEKRKIPRLFEATTIMTPTVVSVPVVPTTAATIAAASQFPISTPSTGSQTSLAASTDLPLLSHSPQKGTSNPTDQPMTFVPDTTPKNGSYHQEIVPHTPYLDRVSPGTLIGLTVTVLLLIPALTVGAFIYWKRKGVPLSARSGRAVSYQHRTAEDQLPVIVDDTYT